MNIEEQKAYNEGYSFFSPEKVNSNRENPYSWEFDRDKYVGFTTGFGTAEIDYFNSKYKLKEYREKFDNLLKEHSLIVKYDYEDVWLETPEGYRVSIETAGTNP